MGIAQAQSIYEPQEWNERIKKAESLGVLGADLFGDSTNYSNGQTGFSATDIDLPVNAGLPVRLVRKLGFVPNVSQNSQLLANWDLDLPYMSGIYAAGRGWQSGSGFARCSSGLLPPNAYGSGTYSSGHLFAPRTYWRQISLNIPNAGAQTLLYPSAANNQRPTDGKTTGYVTNQFWQIRCLPKIANPSSEAGFTGESFEAVSPDGLRYRFDWMARHYYEPLKRQYGTDVFHLSREEIRLYATQVEDHRGNWVRYSYSGNRPASITASDGRSITLGYDAYGRLITATAHGRKWQYVYSVNSSNPLSAELTAVILPDGSSWTLSGSIPRRPQYYVPPVGQAPPTPCGLPGTGFASTGNSATVVITHPSGARGEFKFEALRRTRSGTDQGNRGGCQDDNPDPNDRYVTMRAVDGFALISKTITGPGIASPYVWSMTYSPAPTNQPVLPPTQWTETINPDGSRTKYTYGAQWYVDEGNLLRTETYGADNVLLRDETTTYATGAAAGPYPYVAGDTGTDFEDAFAQTHLTPTTRTTVTQAGVTYTTNVNSFDNFARSLSVTRSNTTGSTKTDVTAYHDNKNYWLLGQVQSVTNSNTGLVVSSATYGSTSARPEALYAFNQLQKTASYNPDGTLRTIANPLNHTTTFGNWKRGIPQSITYPDNASTSAVVNDSGWITSITDPRNATSNFGYDVMGRIASIAYPTGDTVSWAGKNVSYNKLTAAELGIPAGSWRSRAVHGNHQITTYYDALFRPVLLEDRDTTTGANIYTKKAYDHDGQVVFESYPSTSSSPTVGTLTTYDALGRVTRTATTDGVVLSTVAYLSGNRKQVTDADNKVTTITFQAFGEPEYKLPTLIQSGEGQTTAIARDIFGKTTSITQSGLYLGSTLSASRSFTYDDKQRPCRRVDPETGSTVWGYDAASRVIWEAKGQSGTGCLTTAPGSATLFSYDNRSRKTLDDHPGTADDITYGYDAASNLLSIANATSTWTYSYNKRGLPETQQAQLDGKTYTLNPTYDSLGNLASLSTPARTISYSPNAFGQPTRVASGTSYAGNVQYWPSGQIASYSLGNGLGYSQTLDSRLRVQTQQTANGTTAIQRFVYDYTPGGDLTRMDDTVDNTDDLTATYDDLHRLKTATGLWGSYSYSYDPLNNLRTRNLNNASNLSYRYTSNNRLGSITGNQSRSYTYNAKGEITGNGNKLFTLNNLGQITQIQGIASYHYDGNGRRIKTIKGSTTEIALYDRSGALVYTDSVDTAGASNSTVTTTTDYLSLGRKTIAEIATRTTVTPPAGMTNNICATVPSLCITTTTITSKYLHSDLLGSPRKATDASRNLLWQEHFDPYGQKLNGANEKLGYTGHAFDPESGFTYMQARFYDPLVGRFLSTDPVYFKDEDPFTFNRYAYANNNPYKFTDPFGLSSKSIPDDNAKRGIGSNVAGALASSAKSYNFSGGDWTVAGGAASGSGNKQNASSGPVARGDNKGAGTGNNSELADRVTNFVAGFGDMASLGLSQYIREQWDIGSVDYSSNDYETGTLVGLPASAGTVAAGGVAINVGIRAVGGANTLYHFTSTAGAAGIAQSGAINSGSGLFGSGVYASSFGAGWYARLSGAASTEARVVIQGRGSQALATPWPGSFRLPSNVPIP